MILKAVFGAIGTSLLSVGVIGFLFPQLAPYAVAVWATLAAIFITNNVSLVKRVIRRA